MAFSRQISPPTPPPAGFQRALRPPPAPRRTAPWRWGTSWQVPGAIGMQPGPAVPDADACPALRGRARNEDLGRHGNNGAPGLEDRLPLALDVHRPEEARPENGLLLRQRATWLTPPGTTTRPLGRGRPRRSPAAHARLGRAGYRGCARPRSRRVSSHPASPRPPGPRPPCPGRARTVFLGAAQQDGVPGLGRSGGCEQVVRHEPGCRAGRGKRLGSRPPRDRPALQRPAPRVTAPRSHPTLRRPAAAPGRPAHAARAARGPPRQRSRRRADSDGVSAASTPSTTRSPAAQRSPVKPAD